MSPRLPAVLFLAAVAGCRGGDDAARGEILLATGTGGFGPSRLLSPSILHGE